MSIHESKYTRRAWIRRSASTLVAVLAAPLAARSRAPSVFTETRWAAFEEAYEQLEVHMRRLFEACRVTVDGYHLLRPCANTHYNGLWHDDFTWPFVGMPALQREPELGSAIEWLSEAMLDLPVVADRIEFDGTAVMSPGAGDRPPMSEAMPLHLPAAWTRLLSHAHAAGVAIPRKGAWAGLLARSFDRVPLSFGLVWSDPQRKVVGFGFQDSIRLTGLLLLTSLVIKRGYERAADLFEDDLETEVLQQWREKASGIETHLHRLFDPDVGGFVGGTRSGRAFDVWGNGLAWPLATPQQKEVIAATFLERKDAIFLNGCTRQVPDEGGWPGTERDVSYQNGGFWGTGTGFVLPALAEIDTAFALNLVHDLLAHLEAFNFAEWLDAEGQPHGPDDFLGTISMPMIGLRAILENRSVLSYL